jgi:hypothetical protein
MEFRKACFAPSISKLLASSAVDTQDLVSAMQQYVPSWLDFVAGVNVDQLSAALPALGQKYHAGMDATVLRQIGFELVHYKVMIPDVALRESV